MKVLSIRQPWAWLIVNGYKDVENRSWKTQFRGVFLIHAGKKFDKAAYRWVVQNAESLGVPFHKLPDPEDFILGAIVGKAFLTYCCLENSSPWYFGPYGFEVDYGESFEYPIPYKGRLGFFEVDDLLLEGSK